VAISFYSLLEASGYGDAANGTASLISTIILMMLVLGIPALIICLVKSIRKKAAMKARKEQDFINSLLIDIDHVKVLGTRTATNTTTS